MIRKYKKTILITTLIALLPILWGMLLWDKLPEQVATHFGPDGEPDGYSSRVFAVFGLPLMMVGLHLFAIFVTAADPKNKNIGKKPLQLLFWILPCVSLVVMAMTYSTALGKKVDVNVICMLMIGVLFLVLGNNLPKAGRNFSFGMRLRWTLDDDENWNRTNRVAGWCMSISGLVLMLNAWKLNIPVLFIVILVTLLIPLIYSYVFYLRHPKKEEDKWDDSSEG